jgi:Protein of unknown function (DUF2924)
MASVNPGAIEGEIARIRSLDLEGLRREWRRLYHREPPRLSRDLFVLGLGYRLQEIAQGGLSKATRRKLQTMAKALRTNGRVGPAPSLTLKPGARLVREWGGRTHTVTITEDGFEYAGESYPSLTKIAQKITGAHWSGPRFFGLLKSGGERPSIGGAMAEPEKTERRPAKKRPAARSTQENPPKKVWSRLLIRSTPSGRPAPPSFSRKSMRAGRCCPRPMMTADFPAERWSGRP